MHPKPNKFLTALFSFIPGAGHMYFGMMKRGISFMAAFFLSIVCAVFFENNFFTFLNINMVFIFLIPLAWFIAFFDFWRFPRMSMEERLAVKDEFLMLDQFEVLKNATKSSAMRKVWIVAGILLILGGASQLFERFVMEFLIGTYWRNHPNIQNFMYMLPQLGGAVLIIIVGLLLIFWKGRQIKKEAQEAAEYAAQEAAYMNAQEEAYDEE